MIKAIDKDSVHRICSGQVILDLSIAVKELIENSLDAKSSSIEVRLKEYGEESIEVIDNGIGVDPPSFSLLTKKHYTSKLGNFDDLLTLHTFGFRGEALSSLCALCNVSITTRSQSESIATKLIFDSAGMITSQTSVAREVGTTVQLQQLFKKMPVRYQEFKRNIKKEFIKLQSILQSYALVSLHCRILAYNQVGKTPRSCILSTPASNSLRDNVITIYGTSVAHNLDEFTAKDNLFIIEGLISKIGSGQGSGQSISSQTPTKDTSGSNSISRSCADRQFIFLNSRPIDLAALTKIINSLYQSFYKKSSYPVVILNIKTPTDTYDVNVTPDKRTIFFHNQNQLLSLVKEALTKMWETSQTIYNQNSIDQFMFDPDKKPSASQSKTTTIASAKVTATSSSSQQSKINDFSNISVITNNNNNSNNTSSSSAKRLLDSLIDQHSKITDDDLHPLKKFKFSTPPTTTTTISTSQNINENRDKLTTTTTTSPTASNSLVSDIISGTKVNGIDFNALEDSIFDDQPYVQPKIISSPTNSTNSTTSVVSVSSKSVDSQSSINNNNISPKTKLTLNLKSSNTNIKNNTNPNPNNNNSKNDNINSISILEDEDSYIQQKVVGTNILNQLNIQTDDADNQSDQSITPKTTTTTNKNNTVNINNQKQQQEDKIQVKEEKPLNSNVMSIDGFQQKSSKTFDITIKTNIDFIRQQYLKRNGVYEAETYNHIIPKSVTVTNLFKDIDLQTSFITDVDIDDTPQLQLVCCDNENSSQSEIQKQARNFIGSVGGISSARASNTNPQPQQEVEKELSLFFKKDYFKRMVVIGQFNLGFIVAKLDDDFFIIDQHAADEKYNYETLKKSFVLNSQPLLAPNALNLTVEDEMVILEHLDIFKKNGFQFEINHEAPPRSKIKLTALPFSKGTVFGMNDVYEMIFILKDTSTAILNSMESLRLPRINSLLASRACRKSIMVGTALTTQQMKQVINNLSTLDNPWCCPHGRPTMRHLINMKNILNSIEKRKKVLISTNSTANK
ncbi:MutL DNA mismatch repair protein [Tieghemostelium lacteum]|uniref:MutL DNA mismatch repair protein n=1 Tax=Tieghemostelium lacteum TaxID=361077 RepID=A0A151ZFN3_TIELA|nr:MutL DNA mismatch repair protein [Tieghemostelium lacteum]|eukprot:KYQ92674.1 MutL DNA mismatch repair protein [Tieghemostelium lacteum]